MTKSYENILFGLGNPLLDISADVDKSYIEKTGAPIGSAILAEEKHLPIYDELIHKEGVEFIAGGATQNVMRVFQWMLGKDKQFSSTFCGCVGKDKFANQLEKGAKEDGVNVQYLVDEKQQTGTCAVLVNETERTLIANLGAANHYKHDHLVSEPIQKLMKAAQYYYISGFFLTVSPESMVEIGKHAADENKVFMTNLSAMFLLQFFKEKLDQVLPYADYLFGNEDEARAFAKAMGWETEDISEIAKLASKLPKANTKRPRVVVFTEGPKPVASAVYDFNNVDKEPEMKTYEVPKIEKLVDTNGAGDAFCGGFVSQLVQGKSLDQCVDAGIYSSGVIIQRSGCSFPGSHSYVPKE